MEYKKVSEKFLYEIWKKQDFIQDLRTREGSTIEVLEAGIENKGMSGPDFLNAKIKIGGLTYCGDIEIEGAYHDWKQHGHNLNKKYNKVILHAVLNSSPKQAYVFNSDGRKIPTISITECIASDLRHAIQSAILKERENRLFVIPCSEAAIDTEEKLKNDLLTQLGIKRFINKKNKFYTRLRELKYIDEISLHEPVIKYDIDPKQLERYNSAEDFNSPHLWNQLMYESVFEALGYSKNKNIMLKLAKAANISFFNKFEDSADLQNIIEASLFNIAGIMPDIYNLPDEQTSEYTRKLAKYWFDIKHNYDGITYKPTDWNYFGQRPLNFPTIRIAGGAKILYSILRENLIHHIFKTIDNASEVKRLERIVRRFFTIKAEGYWAHHYLFENKMRTPLQFFIGSARADEIVVNILLPIAHLYFEIFGRKRGVRNVLNLYMLYAQQNENRMVHDYSQALGLPKAGKRAVLYQGIIELFRSNCSYVDACKSCPMGKIVFN